MNRFTAVRLLCAASLTLCAIALGSALRLPAIAAEDYQQFIVPLITHPCASTSPCLAYANSKSGAGVEGISSGGHGTIGQTTYKSTSAIKSKAGVLGQDVFTTGTFDSGVLGTSTNGIGVQGTSVNGYGVMALSKYQTALFVENLGLADGVQSIALNNDGTNSSTQNNSSINPGRSGIWGHDDSTDGGSQNVGVAGSSTHGVGVSGSSTNNAGVLGASSTNAGVSGTSSSWAGVTAYSTNSSAFNAQVGSGDPIQVVQIIGGLTNDTTSHSFATFDSTLVNMVNMDNAGNATVHGQIFTAGSCSVGCSSINHRPGNRVVSYAPRESMPTMEDVGIAQLVNGQADVRLDAAFANVIDRQAAYMVFLTPEGQSRGLYVAHKTAAGFTVAENDGGHSTLAFDYRIVAKPFGVNSARLPILDEAHMPVYRAPKPVRH